MSNNSPMLARLHMGEARPAIPLWHFPVTGLEDTLYREEVREVISKYIEKNQNTASDCLGEWEALKVVIDCFCIQKRVGIQKELERELTILRIISADKNLC